MSTCTGPGTRRISNGRSTLIVECRTCGKMHPPRTAQQIATLVANARVSDVEKMVKAELSKPGRENVVAHVDHTGAVRSFLVPRSRLAQHQDSGSEGPGLGQGLKDAQLAALKAERDQLESSLDGLDFAARTRAMLRLDEVNREIRAELKRRESGNRDAERALERTAAAQASGEGPRFLTPKPLALPTQPPTAAEKFALSRPYAPAQQT